MSGRDNPNILTIASPQELDTGWRLLGALCILHAVSRFSYACMFPLMLRAGYAYPSPTAMVCNTMAGLFLALVYWRAAREAFRRNGRYVIAVLIVVIGANLISRLYEVFSSPSSDRVFVLGRMASLKAHPALILVVFMEASLSVLTLIAPVLIARMRQVDPSWALVAFCWLAGQVLNHGRTLPGRMGLDYMLWLYSNLAISGIILLVVFRFRRLAISLFQLLLIIAMLTLAYSLYDLPRHGLTIGRPPAAQAITWLQVLVFNPMYEIVPLILVIWAGRSTQGHAFPDDGSPWPRRYCRNCMYNLYGVESDRCPECGAVLSSDQVGTEFAQADQSRSTT